MKKSKTLKKYQIGLMIDLNEISLIIHGLELVPVESETELDDKFNLLKVFRGMFQTMSDRLIEDGESLK